ncbi:MAG TPA: hypothetical protein VKU01_14480 [Bryobacteraceae bacterium]|nr:hypothetical protein [Bryobacteraceae bacterium]
MSVRPFSDTPALFGSEGELVSLHISVDPRNLEELLETLARLDFPVNPELMHKPSQVTVAFPAYLGRVDQVRKLLKMNGFGTDCLDVQKVLAQTPVLS